jgi:hypothetical protein
MEPSKEAQEAREAFAAMSDEEVLMQIISGIEAQARTEKYEDAVIAFAMAARVRQIAERVKVPPAAEG